MNRKYGLLLIVYVLFSIATLGHLAYLALHGMSALKEFITIGEATSPQGLLFGVTAVWLIGGLSLLLLAFNRFNRSNMILYGGFIIMALLYGNILRERMQFGDTNYFVRAARSICQDAHFQPQYIYPPLWASFLAIFYKLAGYKATYALVNLVCTLSLWVFYFLLAAWLRRLGTSRDLAAILALFALILNVPIFRTLGFGQVDIMVTDFILGSLLLYPKRTFLSAVLLALGAHLKVVPVVFCVLFGGKQRWKWSAIFLVTIAGIVALTTLKDGFRYYYDFLDNIKHFGIVPTSRSCSIDYWILHITDYLVGPHYYTMIIIKAVKGILVVSACILSFLSVKRKSFTKSSNWDSDVVINGAIPLFFITVMLPPTVWVHHLTWLIPSVLALALKMGTSKETALFAAAYFLVFLVPTFEFFPWAIIRLIGWLGLYGLVGMVVLRGAQATWQSKVGDAIERCINDISSETLTNEV